MPRLRLPALAGSLYAPRLGRESGYEMRGIKRHLTLIALLLLSNGCLTYLWVPEASGTDRYGRQWLRVLVPLGIIVSSGVITGIYLAVCPIVKGARRRHSASRPAGDAVEMEGAAVAQICHQQHVPFFVVRSLSDRADENVHRDLRRFMTTAAANAAKLTMAVVGRFARPATP